MLKVPILALSGVLNCIPRWKKGGKEGCGGEDMVILRIKVN